MKGKTMDYKKQEIKEHFENWIKDQDLDWITQNVDDLHHHAFNNDYYIIKMQIILEKYKKNLSKKYIIDKIIKN